MHYNTFEAEAQWGDDFIPEDERREFFPMNPDEEEFDWRGDVW